MKYPIIFSSLFSCCISFTHAQELYSRDVIVTIDTLREFNNTRKPGIITDTYIENGIEIRIFESPFQVAHIATKKKDNLHGLYMEFYLPSNMPKVKGNYQNNNKDGEWYYWDKKGKLLRKEIWKKGKLLTTQKH